MHDIFTKSF